MTIGKLATALTVIFAVSVLVLAAELLFVLLRRRRSSHLRSSQPPISGDDHHPHQFLTSDYSAKQLLYFFCLKSQKRVEPSEAPTQNSDGSPRDDPIIDVFKLLESNGPSRVLCTIKEDDREDVESVDVEVVAAATESEKVTLQDFLESEAVEERAMKVNVEAVEGTKTVFSSPCDSPMFFTPMGSPSRDGTVSPVTGNCCDGGR